MRELLLQWLVEERAQANETLQQQRHRANELAEKLDETQCALQQVGRRRAQLHLRAHASLLA